MKKNVSLQQKVVKRNRFLKNLFLRKREQNLFLRKREQKQEEKGGNLPKEKQKEKGDIGESPPKEENESNYILLNI
tara:strand:+ start:444 stop:671 length:228 start_codon:yes stop_codon:yes gene_type:complete